MKRLGAQHVPIHYVQPELRPGDGRSRKLLLITFSLERDRPPCVSGRALLDFLHEFYRALGVARPFDDSDYQTIQRDVADVLAGQPPADVIRVAMELKLPSAAMKM